MSEQGVGFQPDQQAVEQQRETSERGEFAAKDRAVRTAEEFTHAITEYRSNLNKAVEDPHIAAIAEPLSRLATRANRVGATDHDPDADGPHDDHRQSDIAQVYTWFADNYGGATTLMRQYLVGEHSGNDLSQEAFQEMITGQLAQWRFAKEGMRKKDGEKVKNTVLVSGAQALLDAPHFASVKEQMDSHGQQFDEASWVKNQKMLEGLVISATVDQELATLTEDAQSEALQSWLVQTSEEARSGRELPDGSREKRKIYETPYYRAVLKELEMRSKKRNGVGGVILYGPPGTGKTELIKELNRKDGYDTHVVNLHKYTSFADLLAERQLSTNIDPSASLAEKLGTIVDKFQAANPDQFRAAVTEAFTTLQAQGKVDADQGIADFLRPIVATSEVDLDAVLSADNVDWDAIHKAFLTKQQARILTTGHGSDMQEGVEDIVRGEILLAIKRGKRVLLDELDKAGPSAHGGLLTFLAQSPGESVTFGNTREEIPPWFRVDATSNATDLNEYLRNRFSEVHLGTPPAKDQLMIAATRLIDEEGVVQLSPFEQEQLAAFFTYVVPRANALLESAKGASAISNRDIQSLTANLVNYDNRERTALSMEDSLRKLLIDASAYTEDPLVRKEITDLLHNFRDIVRDQPLVIEDLFGEGSESEDDDAVVEQPLLKVINGLTSRSAGSERVSGIRGMQLDAAQQQQVVAYFAEQAGKPNPANARILDTGLMVTIDRGNLIINAIPDQDSDRDTHRLFYKQVGEGVVVDASEDGNVVAIAQGAGEQRSTLFVRPFDTVSKSINFPNGKLSLSPDGSRTLHVSESGALVLSKTGTEGSLLPDIHGVTDAQFSPDGRTILVSMQGGETHVASARDGRALLENSLPTPDDGMVWKYVGEHMIVQAAKDGSQVGTKALYVA